MPGAMTFTGKLTLALHSKDRKAAAKWYQEKLGLTLLYDVEEIGWCELASPVADVNIGLSQVESPKVGGAVPTLGVTDITASRKQLESEGVRFDGPTHTIPGLVMLATLFDLDGNALMLFQDLSGH